VFPRARSGSSGESLGSQNFSDFQQWWPLSFTDRTPITPGSEANLYFAVLNAYDELTGGPSNSGFRVEFFDLRRSTEIRALAEPQTLLS
jgi:hypothetical protein